MIAAWIVYCCAIGALVALAVHLTDRLLSDAGSQTRRVWAAGLLAATVLPVVAVLVRDGPPAVEVEGALVPTSAASGIVMESVLSLATLDSVLVGLWAAASGLLALRLTGGWLLTARRRRGWGQTRVDGFAVLVSEDVGPAVVGLRPGRIVLPRWALAVSPAERSMIVRHEHEHVAAGDPLLVALAALATAALPWNPALWYMARRLRLAVELDCDRRVMSVGDLDLRSYAELLLAVGARRSRAAPGVGFSVGRPFLEQRIDRMTSGIRRRGRLRAAVAVVGIGVALWMAWDMPQPVRAAAIADELYTCPTESIELNRLLLEAAERST